VQAGRAMLDAIVDVRTPRILLIVRNAFGGAYASFNNYPTGADLVLALPTTRVAVMGPAGKEFVYKDELRKIRAEAEAQPDGRRKRPRPRRNATSMPQGARGRAQRPLREAS
jgi:acetyl-CoA carboxylase carboxyltransferase component